ncbi:MAG TPA: alpha/beta hydrolase [Methanocorpusculum sp.]|nr:alpha/beta hydrolase [Methanocorpusculum sp.]
MKQNILLIEKLVSAFPHRPVYYFSYDFRRSCEDTAEEFAAFLRRNGISRIDIVCHSMGGLVLASYAAKYGLDKVRKIVCLAVPFEGTPLMSQVLITGDVFMLSESVSEMLGLSRDVIRAYPAAADLLPSEEYQVAFPLMRDGNVLSASETADFYARLLPKTYVQSRIRQRILHEQGYNRLLTQPDCYFGISTGKSTIKTLSLRTGKAPEEIRDSGGDGEVPYFSAAMGGKLETLGCGRVMCFDCRHSEMTKFFAPLQWTIDKLL